MRTATTSCKADVETILLLLLLLPLIGSVINAAVGRLLPRRVSEVIACAAVLGP